MTDPTCISEFDPQSLDRIKLVLLDRDGVINYDSQAYIKGPDEWQPFPKSLKAIADLQAHAVVAVCTNQSGLGRGLFDHSSLSNIHVKFAQALRAAGGAPVNIYFCPHTPEESCNCRKPAPGLLQTAMQDLSATPEQTLFVGDSPRDLQAAQACGCQPILVKTGNGLRTLEDYSLPVPVFEDLATFAATLIRRRG
jgi:D-glycero-D-manno-heptose 1,7-bisphosphate phosphatase